MKRLAWLGAGLFLLIVLAPTAAASPVAGSLLFLVALIAILLWLVKGSRSGHGSAKSVRGLTRYRWSDLPEDALLGLAIGDLALAWAVGSVGAVLGAALVGGVYRLCRSSEMAKSVIRGTVGTFAVLFVTQELLVGDLCGGSIADQRALVFIIFGSVGVMAAAAAWSFLRLGRFGPRLNFVELPLLAYGLIEFAITFFTPGGQDLLAEHPAVAALAIPLMLVVAGLAGANPRLVLGLLGVGLGVAKLFLAAVEGQIYSTAPGVDAGTLCYGGWTTVIAAFAFLLISGISFSGSSRED